jgi:predicted  nucleic acid-binding Zn-ribbon protein
MHPSIKPLFEIQGIDLRIAELRAALEGFPGRLKEASARVETARKQLAASKDALTNTLKERKKFELDVEQWKERARKYRDQSAAVKTNEAYKALLHEIATADAEVARAEDRLLDQMVAGEEFERRVKAAEAALKETEASVQAESRQIESEQSAAQKELEAAEGERERAIAPIPEEIRELYTRIARRNQGVGLVEAREEQCYGCGMRLLPHLYQELQRPDSKEVVLCEACGRILYVAEPRPAAQDASAASAATEPRS